MRGEYDKRLRATLLAATIGPGCDQTSLAEALRRDQSGLSKFLRGGAGAPLDLDTAHVALTHCGLGGLPAFVLEAPAPKLEGIPPRVQSFLQARPEFMQLLVDLLDVGPKGHAELLMIAQPFVNARRRTRRAGRTPGTGGGTRTTKAPKPRR